MIEVKAGYVIDSNGTIYVQIPDVNQWGFVIASDDQSWEGGIGIGEWTMIPDDDDRITDEIRESLQWIIDESEAA